MSTFIRQGNQSRRGDEAERVRAIQRSRRMEAGSVTEMARSLLREAREAQAAIEVRAVREVRAECARGSALEVGSTPARRGHASGQLAGRSAVGPALLPARRAAAPAGGAGRRTTGPSVRRAGGPATMASVRRGTDSAGLPAVLAVRPAGLA